MLLSTFCQINPATGLIGFQASPDSDIFLNNSDLFLTPIYVAIIIVLAALYSNQRYYGTSFKKYFIPGLLVKIIGAICVGLIYQYYYNGAGDTRIYYTDGNVISNLVNTDFPTFLKVLLSPGGHDANFLLYKTGYIEYIRDPSAFFVDKVTGVIGIFTFQSYTPIAVVMATLSFFGAWSLYITFCKIYPALYKQFAVAVLFIPSVFFWGSGILKDCITFGCLGWFTYSAYNIFFLRKKLLQSIFLFIVSGYVIFVVKAYIILSFLPSLFFWFFLTYRSRINSPIFRNLLTPILILAAGIGSYAIAQKLGQEASEYSIQNFVKTANTFQVWHNYLAENNGASGYSLGIIDPTPLGALLKFPAAVNVTLFRPYLWEAHNPVVILAAIESLVIFIFTLRIFLRTGIIKTFKIIFAHPEVTFCIFFSLLFAFAVGFTAYNFGALVRYKIPCIPFYVSALFILDYLTKKGKAEKRSWYLKTKVIKSRPLVINEP